MLQKVQLFYVMSQYDAARGENPTPSLKRQYTECRHIKTYKLPSGCLSKLYTKHVTIFITLSRNEVFNNYMYLFFCLCLCVY